MILILYVIVDDVTFGTLSLILKFFFYDSFSGELISETIEEKIKEKMG